MSETGLQIFARKDLLSNIKGKSLEPCIDCLGGKQHRVAFYKMSDLPEEEHILNLVHSDVCSMTEKSLNGILYFGTFVDDHSRKVWICLLKTKDQVLEAFKEFHAKVELETGKKLKSIQDNSGGEYCGPFESYCKVHEIRLEKTPSKTAQLNGIAERMNRTIKERVHCIALKSLNPFWGGCEDYR